METKLNLKCNDVDGNYLNYRDKVVVIDCEDLETETPINRGDVLTVLHLDDPISNFIWFTNGKDEFAFFGHRVLKLNN